VRWTLTPLLGLSHVYYELTDDQGEPRKDDEVWVVTGDIDHNPHISERGKRKFLKRFKDDPLKLQARKSGRWVHFAGRIYDEFEETDFDGERGHLCAPRPIPRATRARSRACRSTSGSTRASRPTTRPRSAPPG
jgi:hypothetical protein